MLSVTCASAIAACATGSTSAAVAVGVHTDEMVRASSCTGRFRAVDLPHTTSSADATATTTEATGSGVAIGDLDGNGLDDIVLAGLGGPTSVLWNRGDFNFDRSTLTESRTRQVTIADVDGDGHNDVLATSGIGPPVWYRNVGSPGADGHPSFAQRLLAGVTSFAYSLGIGDLHGDGQLEIVTGSYNAELLERRDPKALVGDGIGVSLHEPGAEGYTSRQLSDRAQALVTTIADLDGDGRADVIVGNDLSTPDMIWTSAANGVASADPFTTTTLSTMSIDIADYDNDGRADLFATDMKPMPSEPAGQWSRIFEQIKDGMVDDVQRPHNVLQHATGKGFDEVAGAAGVDATGWSWAGLFGDLDDDGLQDLYVVNGMESPPLLADNPGHRLVEENQAFRQIDGRFVPAPEWGLAATAGGRGMAIADLDHDGRLDIVVNNLNAPAALYENDTCAGNAIEVALHWAGSPNTLALGATIAVTTSSATRTRYVNAVRGYLSGGGTTAHVGLGHDDGAVRVEVTWPDGKRSIVPAARSGELIQLTRTESK